MCVHLLSLIEGRGETVAALSVARWRSSPVVDSAGEAARELSPSLFATGELAGARSRLLFQCNGCCRSRKCFPRVLRRVLLAWPTVPILLLSRDSCNARSWEPPGRP